MILVNETKGAYVAFLQELRGAENEFSKAKI